MQLSLSESTPFIVGAVLAGALMMSARVAYSQTEDNVPEARGFAGTVTITTKGISNVPSYTLGKPAALFDVKLGKKKLTFEPQLRFALEGKPWTFLFYWRYRLVETSKFQLSVSFQPVLSFITSPVVRNGVPEDVIVARRFLAGEVIPGYSVTNNLNVSLQYLHSHGFESSTFRNMHFINLSTRWSNLRLSDELSLTVSPQAFYLNVDGEDGLYFNGLLALTRSNFPLSLSALFNKKLKSEISGDEFLWNVSLTYAY
jgi:hypothetical protein